MTKNKIKTLEEWLKDEKKSAAYQLVISQNDYNASKGEYFKGKLKIIDIVQNKLKEGFTKFEEWWDNYDINMATMNYAKPRKIIGNDAWNEGFEQGCKGGAEMSARLTYCDRLIKEYEVEVPLKTQDQIKKFIFSEDDR